MWAHSRGAIVGCEASISHCVVGGSDNPQIMGLASRSMMGEDADHPVTRH
jgi:hypothetical protein